MLGTGRPDLWLRPRRKRGKGEWRGRPWSGWPGSHLASLPLPSPFPPYALVRPEGQGRRDTVDPALSAREGRDRERDTETDTDTATDTHTHTHTLTHGMAESQRQTVRDTCTAAQDVRFPKDMVPADRIQTEKIQSDKTGSHAEKFCDSDPTRASAMASRPESRERCCTQA